MSRTMDKITVSRKLRALAVGSANRSTIAQLRDVIDDVEVALSAGVKRTVILEELANLGLKMSLNTFNTYLKRIRVKRRTKTKGHTLVQPLFEQEFSKDDAPSETSADGTSSPSHNPADIDKIIGNNPDLAALARKAKKRST